MKPRCGKWKVRYQDGSTREVYAYSKRGAHQTGRRAARLVGCKGPAYKTVHVELLHEVGYGAQPGLFDAPDETPNEMIDGR